jgi:DNA repair exonuclease SbcCD ATPase subunit
MPQGLTQEADANLEETETENHRLKGGPNAAHLVLAPLYRSAVFLSHSPCSLISLQADVRSLREQLREATDEMVQLRRQASIRRRQSSADKALKEENEQLHKEIDQLRSVRSRGSTACTSKSDVLPSE